jgi:class 3 adenylate cyclase
VFLLLETLYRAFDELAKHCKVFKIESIGDAYVAVAGLPKPQSKHAVIMARFASLCIERMNVLVVDLEKRLGPGTASLRLRVGLNSGPTTAGVLRSEKSVRARYRCSLF